MDSLKDIFDTIYSMKKRDVINQTINLGVVICSALAIWKSLILITNTESPIVVVLTYY
jgi:signal peptidase I